MISGPERQRLAMAAAATLRRRGPMSALRLLMLLNERGLSGDEAMAVVALALALGLVEREPSDPRILRAPPLCRGRVLVVDGDHEVRAMLSKVLGQLGYEVRVTSSGVACLRRLDAAAGGGPEPLPDALVVDLGVTDIDGLTLVAAIRERPALGRVSLVATSGRLDDGERLRDVPFVPKPLRLGALLSALSAGGRSPSPDCTSAGA